MKESGEPGTMGDEAGDVDGHSKNVLATVGVRVHRQGS